MGRQKTHSYLVYGLLTLLVLLLLPTRALAAPAPGLNLTTSPLPIRLATTPGATLSTSLRVKNSGTEPEQLSVGLMKFGAAGQTGQPNLFERGPADSYFDWVSFTPSTFTAPPGEWIDVRMTI